uniref:Retrotransposable element Tf2 n=1 Tax=Cajanus cajan TaxID=3821 RepID=A0A151SAF8_CAJCA|nr:Retrotransposable element Tf2 [Cajanus cajan]
MVINYKPLNKVLKWIRYPLPNKSELISRIYNATIFSKFDMKSGYYQIKVKEEDKLRKNPKPWTPELTKVVREVKAQVKSLPCLGIPNPEAKLIIETDARDKLITRLFNERIFTGKMRKSAKDQYGTPFKASSSKTVKQVSPDSSRLLSASPNDTRKLPSSLNSRTPSIQNLNTKIPLKKPTYLDSLNSPLLYSNKFNPIAALEAGLEPSSMPAPSKQLSFTPSLSKITPPVKTPSSSRSYEEQYITKDQTFDIMTVEPEWKDISLTNLIYTIFPEGHHYPPFYQPRLFYEFILVDTDSIELTHSRDDQNNIQFSKIKILRIMSPSDWDQPIHQPKSFSRQFQPQTFTYYDYITAWTHILYLQPKTHSWFIWFQRGISLKFPKWFLQWFYYWGPIRELFPNEVSENYDYFKEKTSFLPNFKLISFVASQNITWIVSWDYLLRSPYDELPIKILTRCIRVKWWKKFDLNLLSKKRLDDWVKSNVPLIKENEKKKRIAEDSQFLVDKSRIMAELASAGSQEEFEERLRLIHALQDGSVEEETGSSDSVSTNPYVRNEDMFD